MNQTNIHCRQHTYNVSDREVRMLWNVNKQNAPEAQAAAGAANAANAVDTLAEDTHDQVMEVTKEIDVIDVTEKFNKYWTRMNAAAIGMKEVEPTIKKHLKEPQTFLQEWYANRKIIEGFMIDAGNYKQILDAVKGFRLGSLSPEDFGYFMQRTIFKGQGLPSEVQEIVDREQEWQHSDPHTRMQIGEEAGREGIQKMLRLISNATEEYMKTLESIEKVIEDYRTQKEVDSNTKGRILGRLEFYTIAEIIKSVKNVGEAYKKAWDQWSQLRSNKLSKDIGELGSRLPFGEEAKITLAQELDHKDNEVANSFKEHLEVDNATFEHLTHHGHGILALNQNDGNRFRGALEYAASKGWLYDLNTDTNTVLGYKLAAGKTLPATWNAERVREYVRKLDKDNRAGASSEMERGYSRVQDKSDIPPMIEIMEDEMNRQNYWAIHGIVKRAIEKGKEGETSAWLSAKILRYLKEDKTAKRYFPKDLMDKLGNLGIVSPVWLTTLFKIDRNPLEHYQKGHINFENAGHLANAFSMAEEEVLEQERIAGRPNVPRKRLDRLIAKILASQTVYEDGWDRHLSLFADRYKPFRDHITSTTTTINPGDADDDFYNSANSGSEVVLMSPTNFGVMVKGDTTGAWTNPAKTQYFYEQLIYRVNNLKANGMYEELKNYLDDVRPKMSYVIGEYNHGSNGKLATNKFYENDTNRPLFLELFKCGLIDKKQVEKTKKEKFGEAFWPQISNLADPKDALIRAARAHAKSHPTPRRQKHRSAEHHNAHIAA